VRGRGAAWLWKRKQGQGEVGRPVTAAACVGYVVLLSYFSFFCDFLLTFFFFYTERRTDRTAQERVTG
jgi:hypothetical protein